MADKLEPGASSELIKLAAAIRDAAAAFVEAMDEQGRHQKSYWFYSPKANAHVTVFGDVALMYSLLDEIDPDVVRVEIEDPTAVAHIDEEYVGIRLDGRVTYRGGRVEWREYKRHSDLKDPRPRVKRQVAAQRAAAEAVGAHYMLKDERGLVGRHDACLNALTLIGWRNRCQGISSVRERAALETHFAGGDCATLQQLLTFPETDPALMLSCIAESLSSGSLSADLTKPLTRATVITRGTARASNDGEQLEDEPRKIVAARLPTRGDFEGIPSERLDINRWRRPYPGAMKRREEYLRREEAIFLFYDGASDAHIRDKTGLSGPEVLRHVIVCATDDGRGQPIGFVALVPGYLRKYRREAPPPQNNQVEAARGGFSGLFQNLLRDFPEALEVLVDSTLEIAKARELKVKRPSWSSITTSFLTCLTSAFEKAGRAPDAYPFGTGDMAYAAVRKFCKDLLSGNASRWISLRRGRESMERSRLGRGFSPLLRPTRAMQTIALDFHKVNALSAIEVDTPDGGALEAVLPRWWIGRIVCCSTSTSLATTLSLQRNTTKECVLDLVDALVRAPQLRKSLKIRGGYPSGCWQPNQMIPELEFMGVDLLLLDHAWAHESPQVLAKIAQTLGCAICFGSVRQWWQRIPIERSFLETARVTNAVPSSVGSSSCRRKTK